MGCPVRRLLVCEVDSASLGAVYHPGDLLEGSWTRARLRWFVGPNEPEGWALAGTIVPIAYIAWSIWLILIGVFLLIG